MNKKLPLVEWANRWIDIYTYLHYPEEVRETSFAIFKLNNNKKGYPHVLAATSVYLSCKMEKTKFEFELMNRITKAHRFDITIKSGLKLTTIENLIYENNKKEVPAWTLPKPLN